MARTILRTLCEMDPDASDRYQANLDGLLEELDRLHDEVREILSPFAGRRLYLYHPAWGYFCDAFGLEQVAIEVEGKEPSDEELTRIQEQMRADETKAIFVQPQIEGRSAEPVARAVGASLKILDPLRRDVITNLRDAAQAIAESYQ
jgi:zinc transport system substrate-binding protein